MTSLSTGSILSPAGSVLLADSGGSLVTSAGTWTFSSSKNASGSLILLDGASAAGGAATKLEVANNGQLYADNAQGQWYEWVDGGWGSATAPTVLSPNGSTVLAGSTGSLTTTAGKWTFSKSTNASGSLILLNGASAAGGSAAKLEVANSGHLYADNAQGDWYEWVAGGWTGTSSPNTTTTTTTGPVASTSLSTGSTPSPDGSVVLAGSGGSLVTSAGTWTFSSSKNASGSLILLDGASAAGGAATKLEVANNGQLYADNAQGQWYEWVDGGWGSATAPTVLSPNGSTVLAGSTGSLTTTAGKWTFSKSTNASGSLILLNGASAAGGSAAKLEVANSGHLYADNAQGDWYEWVAGGWTGTSSPDGTTGTGGTGGTGGTTSVDTLPVLLKPTQTGDIVGMRLQNIHASTENAGYITFGQVFKTGAVKPTDTLVARINGANYALQMDVKATNSDGSVRQAILTLKAPAIAAGSSLDIMLAKGTAAAPSNLAPSASSLLASGYNVSVNFTFYTATGSTSVSTSAATALQAALNNGKVENWLSGPQGNEFDVETTVYGGKLKVDFHIRVYADGTSTTDVIFNNSWMFASGKADLNYDVTISQGGKQVYSATGVPQYLYSTWHHEVASAGTISPNVQYNIPYLEATGAIAYYDTSLGVSSATIQGETSSLTASNTGPLGTAGVTTYMPETGGRTDIGLQPAWTIAALLSQDTAANQAMFANADAAGSIPWHFIDEKTGEAVNTQTYPNFWDDYRGTLVPANGWPSTNPADVWAPEAAHMPDLNYVPYLLSGSSYQLSELQAQANFALSSTPPQYGSQYLIDGKYPAGFVLDGMNEIRAEAWDLREVAEAAYLTPDSDPLKSYFVSALQQNMQALVQQYIVDNIDGKYGAIEGFVGMKPGEFLVAPWQEGYVVTVLGEIAGMNMPQVSAQAVQMLKWMNNFVSGLFTKAASGYNPLNGPGYWLAVADPSTGAPYTTWSQFYNANVNLGNLSANPTSLAGYPLDTQGGYPEIAAAALATEITYTKSPLAIQAYGYVISQITNEFAKAGQDMTAAYQASPIWTQVPKLPDGVLLTHSQMQIDTSSNNVTLSAKNGDSLLSVVGGGTDILNGGTGGCDLMFGGTGNDTFNAGTGNDYLFGGSGTNTFVDNIGNDYYRAAGKANTFVFDDIHSGHDTIANFHTSTDILKIAANLNGNGITNATQLIAGATVSGGSTVLHLSASDDITLCGVSNPSSLATSLVFN